MIPLKPTMHILVVRTDRIGDVVLSLPVVTALRRRFPDCTLAMLVQPEIVPLVAHHPDLNQVLTDGDAEAGVAGFFRLIRKLHEDTWDMVLLLHPTFRLAAALTLAGIPVRAGTAYRFYSFLLNRRLREHRKTGHRHEAEFNLSLARMMGVGDYPVRFNLSIDPEAERAVSQWFIEHEIDSVRPKVVLHPGSRGSARDWPAERFVQLADQLIRENRAEVFMTGTKEEGRLIRSLTEMSSGRIHNLSGRLTLKELVAFLDRIDLFISNSTGPLHIAAALGTRVIGLYPNLRPASVCRWGPWAQSDHCLVANHSECIRCKPEQCGNQQCMTSISVEDVWQKANQILESDAIETS